MASSNLGPLTTTFAGGPSSCTASFGNIYITTVSGDQTWTVQGPVKTGDCFPSGYSAEPDQYYSPGVCPSNYAAACSTANSVGTVTETIYTCCPVNYTYQCSFPGHPGFGGCFYNVPSTSQSFTSVYEYPNDDDDGSSPTRIADLTAVTGAINAQSIQVRFQAGDITGAAATSSVAPKTSGPSSPSSSSLSNNESTTTNNNNNNNSLPQTTKIAIGLGVSLGLCVALLAAALILYILKKKKQNQNNTNAAAGFSSSSATRQDNNNNKRNIWAPPPPLSEMEGTTTGLQSPPAVYLLDGNTRHELPDDHHQTAQPPAAELPSSNEGGGGGGGLSFVEKDGTARARGGLE